MLRYMYFTSLVPIAMNIDYFPKNCGQRTVGQGFLRVPRFSFWISFHQ